MEELDRRALRRKRAFYRARHRGSKELDWLLGRFAEAELDGLDDGELDCFEQLLEIPDTVLERWIKFGEVGADPKPSPGMAVLVTRVRRAHRLEE